MIISFSRDCCHLPLSICILHLKIHRNTVHFLFAVYAFTFYMKLFLDFNPSKGFVQIPKQYTVVIIMLDSTNTANDLVDDNRRQWPQKQLIGGFMRRGNLKIKHTRDLQQCRLQKPFYLCWLMLLRPSGKDQRELSALYVRE